MQSYRLPTNEIWYAIICKSNNKIGIRARIGTRNEIKDFYKRNEPTLEILDLKKIQNVPALQYFIYNGEYPTAERKKKFDFFKYVLKANLSDEYRSLFA